MANPTLVVTATAPVNMAVIKYWGKRDESLILPINSSLSATLNQNDLCSTTTIAASKDFKEDIFWLNGQKQDMGSVRIQNCLRGIRARAEHVTRQAFVDGKQVEVTVKKEEWPEYKLRIVSKNNFPTAAGLASSASGYACFVAALGKLYGTKGDLSTIARQGSGSACRSMYGGWVKWERGTAETGEDSKAVQVLEETHWPSIHILVCVVNDAKKAIGSSDGMRFSVQTSPTIHNHADNVVPVRIKEMETAITERNFDKFAELTMKDSDTLHAICADTTPPIHYLNDTSRKIISLVNAFNKHHESRKAAYTFDAGPNAVLFAEEADFSSLLAHVLELFPAAEDLDRSYINDERVLEKAQSEQPNAEIISDSGLSPEKGLLKYLLHTTVGEGPRYPESHLINTSTWEPNE